MMQLSVSENSKCFQLKAFRSLCDLTDQGSLVHDLITDRSLSNFYLIRSRLVKEHQCIIQGQSASCVPFLWNILLKLM